MDKAGEGKEYYKHCCCSPTYERLKWHVWDDSYISLFQKKSNIDYKMLYLLWDFSYSTAGCSDVKKLNIRWLLSNADPCLLLKMNQDWFYNFEAGHLLLCLILQKWTKWARRRCSHSPQKIMTHFPFPCWEPSLMCPTSMTCS